ncbi:MAG: L-2-hydroxyglutarate oxidase [Arthrobacter sp.]
MVGEQKIGIIGGGIVGIALAGALAVRGLAEVTVYEKETRLALHQTGRNSGVVHAGLYYKPGSLKARLCAEGRQRIRDYCLEKSLPYREVGKLVVAVDEADLPALADIETRFRPAVFPAWLASTTRSSCGRLNLTWQALPPSTPRTPPPVDYAAITEAMAQDVRAAGGRILLGQEVTGLQAEGARVRVRTAASEQVFDQVVACAGPQSDVVARLAGADPSPKILPFRGEYWELSPQKNHLVNGMIYPLPDPAFPFLGVHFTRGVYDDIHVGPNAVPALAREGYSWGRVSVRDTL